MRTIICKTIFISLTFFLINSLAYAKDKITFNYGNMSISSVGIYNPKLEGEKSGLHAELIARKNGIDNLSKYFENSCEGVDKNFLDIRSDWEKSLRSQGTEIYSNGILAVTLEAPLKYVFKTPTKTKKFLKTDEGEKVVFQLPNNIPLAAIRCGTLGVNLEEKKVHFVPAESVEISAGNIKIIHLAYNEKKAELELESSLKKEALEILDNSTFSDIDDVESIVLPITVTVNQHE